MDQRKQIELGFNNMITDLEDKIIAYQDDTLTTIEEDSYGLFAIETLTMMTDDIIDFLRDKIEEFSVEKDEYTD